jgi:hypothetical protein
LPGAEQAGNTVSSLTTCDFSISPRIVRAAKSRQLKWAVHASPTGGIRNAFKTSFHIPL